MSNKILLVDDDAFQLKVFERLLQSHGYEVNTATSVKEADVILKSSTPDLIISDYEMPETNGFEFRQKLLRNPLLKEVPFLFLTSFNDDQLIQQGLDLQAWDYIPKNIPPSQLLAKINNFMLAIKEQYERSISELKGIAEKLNLKNVPASAPEMKGFTLEYFSQSYKSQPGGDFIDFIKINDRYTFVVLGDVMGKKWGAWFFSFSFLSYIRAAIRVCVFDGTLSLSEILHKINQVINADELLNDIFSTLSLLLLDDEQKTIKYAGAGDLPLFKFEKASLEIKEQRSEGVLLGFFKDASYQEKEINMEKEDELFLFSDGLIDFEIDGTKRSDIKLLKSRILDLKVSGKEISEIKEVLFNERTSQVDDCSFIVIKRK